MRLTVDDDLERSRLTVLFRLLLAIPLFIWVAFWTLAVVVAGVAGWLIAVATGRLPEGLHKFFASYVRFAMQVGAYIAIAASPYPGFTGEPGYPVDVRIPRLPERQARWKIALRLALAVPALILAAVLGSGIGGSGGVRTGQSTAQWFSNSGVGGVAAVCAVLGWFAAVALGRMPLGIRNLAAYCLGYTAQAYAYTLLLTDRYPNADPEAIGPDWELPPHPVTLVLDDDLHRSRLTALFRLLLALPHVVWLLFWTIAAFLASIVNALVVLVRGRSAAPLHRFLAAYIRYTAHVSAFAALVANPFPGFMGARPYPVGVEVGGVEPQSRWVTFFRIFLAIPALLISGALGAALFVVAFLGWLASILTGRMPHGLRNLGAVAIRYHAQGNAYLFIVTDTYPHASPALWPRAEPEPEPEAAV